MVSIDDYRRRYKFLYDYIQNSPGFMSSLESILFPENENTVDASSVKDIIDSRISRMSDEVHERVDTFNTDDVLKALVAYGDILPEYGQLLANNHKLTSRRKRFCRIPVLQSIANFFMMPWDSIRTGLDCGDADWVNLQVCVLQSKEPPVNNPLIHKFRTSDKLYSRDNPKPRYEIHGNIIEIKMD